MNQTLKIAHLFPDLLNLYGDRGNIITMKNRLLWRGIGAEVQEYGIDDEIDLVGTDIVFCGGGSDREQLIVCQYLNRIRKNVKAYVEDGGTLLAVCGSYQLLGHYYQLEKEKIEGLSVLDLYTESGKKRLIGNVVLQSEKFGKVVGFENHAGRTYINGLTPFGKVLYGNGNNGKDGYEGVIYKNVIGTYLHGPLLPKNPVLCDHILKNALERKYGTGTEFSELNDKIESMANDYVVNRFLSAK
mgnify:FL=1